MNQRKAVKERKRTRALAEMLHKQYGIEELPSGIFALAKGRWRFATPAAAELAGRMKAVRSVGIALTGEHDVLTIEACQILNPKENVIELDNEQAVRWLRGEAVELGRRHPSRYIAAKHGVDWLGGGLASGTKLVPGLPGWRRIKGRT